MFFSVNNLYNEFEFAFACHLFTRYKRHSRFGSLMNYFVSLETDIWVERKKKSDVSEKIYFSKKQAELNELRKNVLLK